jgi:ATP-dependent Lon protease
MHGDADGSCLIRNAAAYRHLERHPVGGELLTIEAAIMPGKGRVTVTGNLRDVMRESIRCIQRPDT